MICSYIIGVSTWKKPEATRKHIVQSSNLQVSLPIPGVFSTDRQQNVPAPWELDSSTFHLYKNVYAVYELYVSMILHSVTLVSL